MIALALALAAAPPDYSMQYYGFPGNDSCANWTQNRASRERSNQVLEGWVLGFVTGYNRYGDPSGGRSQGGNATALFGWIDQYCAANPLDSLFTASMRLVDELKRRAR